VASSGAGFLKANLRQERHGGAHLEKPKKKRSMERGIYNLDWAADDNVRSLEMEEC